MPDAQNASSGFALRTYRDLWHAIEGGEGSGERKIAGPYTHLPSERADEAPEQSEEGEESQNFADCSL